MQMHSPVCAVVYRDPIVNAKRPVRPLPAPLAAVWQGGDDSGAGYSPSGSKVRIHVTHRLKHLAASCDQVIADRANL